MSIDLVKGAQNRDDEDWQRLCTHCRAIEFKVPLGNWTIHCNLGTYRRIQQSAYDCPGCQFFYQHLQDKEVHPEIDSDTPISLSSREHDTSCELGSYSGVRTDHIMPRVKRGEANIAYCEDHNSHYIENVPTDINDNSWKLARLWQEQCNCASRGNHPLPKRLLEVQDHKTIRLASTQGTLGSYIALSHCWGDSIATSSKLTSNKLQSWQDHIDLENLAQKFVDAVMVASELGVRYLWIDALCILQDSLEDWELHAQEMAKIYGWASMVVGASRARDASQGFLGSRVNIEKSPVLGIQRQYHLLNAGEDFHQIIGYELLARRGWCAQEYMMAQCILIFTERCMLWECAHGWRSEFHSELHSKYKDIWADYLKPSAQPTFSALLRGQSYQSSPSEERKRRLAIWRKCVENYSGRDLTFPEDKLPAIAGLANLLNDDFLLGEYLAGVWSCSIGQCLAWVPQTGYVPETDSFVTLTATEESRCRAPSWSWARVEAVRNVAARFVGTSGPQEPIEDDSKLIPQLVTYEIHTKRRDQHIGSPFRSYITLDCFYFNVDVRLIEITDLGEERIRRMPSDVWLEAQTSYRISFDDQSGQPWQPFDPNMEGSLTLDFWTNYGRGTKQSTLITSGGSYSCIYLHRNKEMLQQSGSDQWLERVEFYCMLVNVVDKRARVFERIGLVHFYTDLFSSKCILAEFLETMKWQRDVLKLI